MQPPAKPDDTTSLGLDIPRRLATLHVLGPFNLVIYGVPFMDNTRHWHERYRLTFGKRRGTLFDQKTVRWEDLVHQRTSYPLWSNDEQ